MPEDDSIWVGLVLGFICVILSLFLAALNLRFVLWVGLTQFVFLGPLIFYFYKAEKTRAMIGVIVIACVTILLNASCLGLVYGIR